MNDHLVESIVAHAANGIRPYDEAVACNLCGSKDVVPFCPANGRGLVQCLNCGLVYVHKRPPERELYSLYEEGYFSNDISATVGYVDYINDEPLIRHTFHRRLRELERYVKPGRVLDVGCAAGFFLDVARERGWESHGLDVSGFAVRYARERFGLDVFHGSLTEAGYPEAFFDLVTMWDVIEHVPDPMSYLRESARILRRGGVLALATPDVESIPARLTGRRWVGYKLSEEHLYYFSRTTMRRMLEKAGFEVLHTSYVGKYVTVDFFLERLSLYSPLLARLGKGFSRLIGIDNIDVYVNPYDILCVIARRI